MQGRMMVALDILTPTLDENEWLDSRSGWITSGGGTVSKYWTEG